MLCAGPKSCRHKEDTHQALGKLQFWRQTGSRQGPHEDAQHEQNILCRGKAGPGDVRVRPMRKERRDSSRRNSMRESEARIQHGVLRKGKRD